MLCRTACSKYPVLSAPMQCVYVIPENGAFAFVCLLFSQRYLLSPSIRQNVPECECSCLWLLHSGPCVSICHSWKREEDKMTFRWRETALYSAELLDAREREKRKEQDFLSGTLVHYMLHV